MNAAHPIARRVYTATDQKAFAVLSGDNNPLHVDAEAARRSIFGQPVVHGVHQLLWALESHYALSPSAAVPASITARFLKPAFLGEALNLSVVSDAGSTQLRVHADEALLAQVTLIGENATFPASAWHPATRQREAAPHDRAIAELAGANGSLALDAVAADIAAHFPAATRRLGAMTVAALLGLTRLVGMECPGLHSIFSSLAVSTGGPASNLLGWQVTKASAKLSIVNIDVSGGGLAGKLVCFVRPAPQAGPDAVGLADRVAPRTFAGRRALIIGGSRGLGQASARLLALGGADVALTWHRGRVEAETLVAAITADGGSARAVQLDTSDPASGLAALAATEFAPDELYYFATPHIFTRKKALFEPELFAVFADSYVSGLMRVVSALRPQSGLPLRIFLPSSESIDVPLRDLFEYTVAKAAAEQVARLLPLFDPAITVITRRLPRLPTDQTATLIAVPAADPVKTMLEVLAAMAPAATIPASSHLQETR